MKMNKFNMFVTAVCVLFLIKLRWPKNKSIEVDLFFTIITYRAKLLNADWLRQRAFFLNHNLEGTFGNQRGHDYLMLIG